MGVLNVTPDSFSDGGRYLDVERAIARAFEIEAEGADILDLGGESTRPPHLDALPAGEELRRILPVLEHLQGRLKIPISVDTYKAEVAEKAILAGAEIINDIGGLRFDEALLPLLARHKVAVVIMHSRGRPETMHQQTPVKNMRQVVSRGLKQSLARAMEAGIKRNRMVLDPGLGFGKTVEDNLLLLRKLDTMNAFRMPWLIGASRKSFIGKILNLQAEERLAGSLACLALAIWQGAHIVRVHDVRASCQVARVCDAIMDSGK